ncbi:U4/U6.U5 tri-snRNP-associated protein 1 [Leptidea sinapis]|uniref:U4/U6.U5 tri-snRNP-associated protein 1 n=1 Tax=Leptidea sinapis TaxID=189913 RepID=UPI00213D84BC|nr:U4/U6.U5 tri-snRNP-associated protein 1 [Leptidea sinapis]
MGSKKHKKDSKKKKHRSRSRSPLDGEERERKRHKKHKDRKKDRSPDVEEVPVDSHLNVKDNGAVRSRSRSTSIPPTDTRKDKSHDKERRTSVERSVSPIAQPSSNQESLSIEETNKLRAKLGLKPLEVTEKTADDGKIKDDLGEFYHKPAANITQQKKTEKIRERLEERKEKRKLEKKLKTTLLVDEVASDDEDASAWVKKSREMEKQKQEAAKRAAMLDEMDEVFGVSELVAQEQRGDAELSYRERHLRGLRVAHDMDLLPEERDTILTLADKDVLAEDNEDVLVNVNIVDDERYKKNIKERRKAAAGYQAYDEENEMAEALGLPRAVLAKYDEELEPGAAERSRGFLLGEQRSRDNVATSMQDRLYGAEKRLESLRMPELRVASDYMDEHEISAKFKKVKKKGKMRKKAKQEPIDVEEYEAGTAPLETDDTEVKSELERELQQDEDEVEVDAELQAAVARARRLRQAPPTAPTTLKVEDIERVKEEEEPMEESGGEGSAFMVLDATAEFCRTLGEIPTYGLAPNRDTTTEIMDFERDVDMEVESEIKEEHTGEVDEEAAGAWSRVDIGKEKPVDLVAGSSVGLEAEPALGAGVAGALQLALSKGYLERAGSSAPRPSRQHPLAAAHYSIDDKQHGEDDKYSRRERGHDRGHGGPVSEFREKNNFRPSIKLEYVDDEGRPLCPKEAFRYLSHKFHGKGPGKNKQEKRIKKAVQEGLMKKMSSTDTPLGTLHMLQQKQKETHSPYVLLSGNKKENNA